MNTDNISIIIQGPANKISLNYIDNYLSFGKVIVSCYSTDNINDFYLPREVTVIKNSLPSRPYYDSVNIFKQYFTTLRALQICDTEYAIKVRSDEFYSDMSKFIETVENNPLCLTTNNVWFDHTLYHPSDHMIGSSTLLLKNTCELIVNKCYEHYNNQDCHFWASMFGYPVNRTVIHEIVLFLSFMKIMGLEKLVTWDKENSEHLLKEYCKLVNVDDLGENMWTWNTDPDGIKHYNGSKKLIEKGCRLSL